MSQSLLEYCRQNDRMELLDQWDAERNQMSPAEITFGSNKKVWWRCGNGHEWQAVVQRRTSARAQCPYCTGREVTSGQDFASLHPELIAQWHWEKNLDLEPNQVGEGSQRAVWWKCEKEHEWIASIRSRVFGGGCPVCSNRKIIVGVNDLGTTHPNVAAEWHPTKNGQLTPQQIVYGTARKVWWKCGYGHEWQAYVFNRARGVGCPVCAGRLVVVGENDLASGNPQLAAQWDYEKNELLRPEQVSLFSNKAVWWRCSLGHQWQCKVASRSKSGTGCPVCTGKTVLPGFNDLKSQMPEIAKDWHPTLNGRITPEMVTAGSSQRAWWQCAYGHVWKAVISSRTGRQKCGCPACAGKIKQAKKWYYEAIDSDAALKNRVKDPEEMEL